MKLPRAAAALAVAAVLAVSVAAIARHYLHPAQLTDALVRQVHRSTGRDLVIGGATGIKLFPRPAIVLEDVRFRNAAWGSQPWMATVDRAEAEMQWGPLLRGEISIARIHLAGAALLLETDAGGNDNWVMGSPDTGPADLSWLTGFQIDDLSLHPLKLGYRDGTTGDTGELLLHQLSLQAPAAPQPIHFHAQGTYSGNSFEAQGTVGALATLLAGDHPYPVAVSASIAGSRIEISGDIAEPLKFTGLNLELRQQGAELSELAALAGQSLPSLGAYRLSARISGSRDALSLSAVDLAIGSPEGMEFRVQGGIELRRTGSQMLDVSAVDLELQAKGRELREFLALAGKDIPPAGPYAMSARLSGPWDAPGLSGIEFEAGSPERAQLRARGTIARPRELAGLDLEITAVARHGWRLGEAAASPLLPPFRIKTRVRDRQAGYAFDDLELEVAGSRVNATVVATRREQRLHVAARAASPLIDLARVLASADTRPASGGGSSGSGTSPGGPPVLLHLADVDLDLQIGKLVLRDGRALTGVSGRVALTREKLAISSGRLTAGGAGLSVEGSVTDPGQGAGIDLALGIQGKEMAELLNFGGIRIPPIGPYQGTARAQGSLEALRLTGIDAQAGKPGQAQLRAKGKIADLIKGEGLDLALAADISDPGFPSRLAGRELPRLPPLKLSAHFTNPRGEYALDDLKLALGRTALQGRVAYAPAEPRPRISTSLTGAMVDLSEIRPARGAARSPVVTDGDPLKAADLDAELRLDRLVLPGKRALGPVSGRILLNAGVAELRQLAVSVDGARAVVDGTVAKLLEPAGLDLAVKAEVKDATALAALTGTEIPKLPPFTGSGKLSDVEGGYAVSGLTLAFASTMVSGDLSVTRAASRYRVKATLASPLFDVAEFLPEATTEAAASMSADARYFSDTPLPFASLRLADADLDLRVEKLQFRGGLQLGPVIARGTLADGRLAAELLQIGVHQGRFLEVAGTVDASSGKRTRIALRIEGKSIDLGEVRSRMGHPGEVTGGITDLKLDLTGRGNSPRSLAAGLNGSAWIKVGPARLHQLSLDLGTGIVERVIGLVNPFRKTDPDTDLKCLAVKVPIAAGVIKSDRGIAVETAKFNAVASGTMNLATEAIAMGVTPVVNQGFGLGTDQLVQMVRIGGTIANPDIGVSAGGAARAVASLGADVATAGGWLLADALLKKVTADPHPCATALGE